MDGYRTTGFFLAWLTQTKSPDFLRKFNRSTLEVIYYIEGISGKGFTLRIEFKEPLHYDMGGFRNTYKENLSPDLRPDSPYKVFDSNEEAIARPVNGSYR